MSKQKIKKRKIVFTITIETDTYFKENIIVGTLKRKLKIFRDDFEKVFPGKSNSLIITESAYD